MNTKRYVEIMKEYANEAQVLPRSTRTVLFAHCSGNEPPPYFKKLPNGYYELFLHADINYGFEECQEFVKWITPYVAGRKKNEYIGWCKGEDYNSPVVNLYVQRA